MYDGRRSILQYLAVLMKEDQFSERTYSVRRIILWKTWILSFGSVPLSDWERQKTSFRTVARIICYAVLENQLNTDEILLSLKKSSWYENGAEWLSNSNGSWFASSILFCSALWASIPSWCKFVDIVHMLQNKIP